VIQLVQNAPAGLSVRELEDLLELAARSFLSPFRNHSALKGETHQGRFVYYATEPKIYRQPKAAQLRISSAAELPTNAEAITMLVPIIKHPNFSMAQIHASLK